MNKMIMTKFKKNKLIVINWGMVVCAMACQNHRLHMDTTTKEGIINKYQEGIDISRHQGDINWNQLTPTGSGKTFVIAKASQRNNFTDSKFVQNWKDMDRVGFQRGAYHFVEFGSNVSEPKEQMNNFLTQLRRAGEWSGKDILALDIEEFDKTPVTSYHSVAPVTEGCVSYLKEQGIIPYIYTRKGFWDKYVENTSDIIKECPLWIARWSATEPSELPNGWDDWTIWQYSDKGNVPGIKGNVDLDRMKD